jgi:hypothetical protein
MTPAGFPHSDTPGSTLGCQLPRAYRRLLRPSSALDAKASTTCPSQLVTHTTNPHHPTHHRPTHSRPTDNKGGGTGRRCTQTRHKEPTHTGQSTGACTQQTRNPHTHTHPAHRPQRSAQASHVRELQDARVHYPDLKQQPHTPPAHTSRANQPSRVVLKPHTRPTRLCTGWRV